MPTVLTPEKPTPMPESIRKRIQQLRIWGLANEAYALEKEWRN
jgi:hypothetical protein